MIRHLITLIWNQRKQNSWIFAELALVLLAVFMITDAGYSKYTLYHQPLGYDISHCWRLHLEEKEPGNEGYTGEDERGAKCWERITELTQRLMNTGEVEAVGCSFYSCPYSQGNSWTNIEPAGADSINGYSESIHRQLGDAGFFEVFNIRDVNGTRIRDLENPGKDEIIITEKVAEKFFGQKEPRGRLVSSGELDEVPVLAVAPTIREDDFQVATPTFYIKASPSTMAELFEVYRPSSLEYSVRMKGDKTQAEMEQWLASLGDRLTSGNVYVNAVTGFEEMRSNQIEGTVTDWQMMQLIVAFLLLNVFFGVTGTFWMRTQTRRSETGLRMAIGASKGKIISWLNVEGLFILLLACVPIAVVIFNFRYMDLLNAEVPYTMGRWLAEIAISVGIIAVMIVLGIAVPARWIMKEQPAEALHYE